MKKKTGLFFTILFITIFSVFPSFGETIIRTNEDYEYEICDSLFEPGKTVAYISDYIASSSNAKISIPSEIDGYDVEGIGHFAFQENEDIEEVYAEDGLKFIGYFSFSECKNLKKIHLPDSVETILDGAFMRCDKVSYFDIPSKIKTVGECIISGNNLKRINNKSDIDLDILLATDATDYKYSWFYDEYGIEEATLVPSNSTIYRRRVDFDYSTLYADKYMKILSDDNIPMKKANSEKEIIEYISQKAPSEKPESVSFSIVIDEFTPAISGTRGNKEGQFGHVTVLINIKNILDENDIFQITHTTFIEPTLYIESSSDSGSSSSGSGSNSTNYPNNIIYITKESAKDGTWVSIGGLWKLKLSSGYYASSQWAFINEKWYLLGDNGIMKTDWQKVNGKWYFLSNDGSMLTGWRFINEKWYWMDNDGAMLENGKTPDGYTVNENGELI